ncbi:MAG: radical SAM protein [Eubacteriales bacterium]|nr:radical SAM protein [Eubacteriales bacterium]
MHDKTAGVDFSGNLLETLRQAEKQGMDAAAAEKVYNEYFSFQTRKKAVPYQGMFELTPLCNLKCKMCYVRLSPEQLGERSLLMADTWIRMIDQAAAAGMMKAALTGGECLTHPDFDAIYLHLQELGIRTAVLTNGILLNEDRIRFFQRYPPALIQITLYGASEEEYEQVCGTRHFETVLANIRRAQEAGLSLFIAITPNRFLTDGGEALLKLAVSLDIPYNINSCLFTPHPGTGREKDNVDMEMEDYIRLYKLRAQMNGEVITPVDPASLPEVARQTEPQKLGLRCGAGMNAFTIQWDGAMIPCSSLLQIRESPLRDGFQAAWNAIHEAALHFPIPAECEACEYNSVCPSCVAIHAQDAPPGHASPRRCQCARQLVESGLVRLHTPKDNDFSHETKKEAAK